MRRTTPADCGKVVKFTATSPAVAQPEVKELTVARLEVDPVRSGDTILDTDAINKIINPAAIVIQR